MRNVQAQTHAGTNDTMSQLVLLEKSCPIAILTLNRPERHNSLVPTLLQEMLAAVAAIRADREVRAVVLKPTAVPSRPVGTCAVFTSRWTNWRRMPLSWWDCSTR